MVKNTLSYADHAWLRMDDPANLMVITGLMTFDAPLDYERLKALLEDSLVARFQRFRQRLAPPLLPFMLPTWEDDPNYDLAEHLKRVTLPAPANQENLQDLISELMSTPLVYSRPLWQFYLVENYQGGSAFIARLHHAIADGIALVQVLLSLTTTAPDAAQPGQQAARVPVNTLKSTALPGKKWTTQDFLEEGDKILHDPAHARLRARQGLDFAAAVGRLALRWPDPRTIFKGPLGIEKRAAWSKPLELKDVKLIGRAFQSTVNDVLITTVTGALGRYLDDRGEASEDVDIRSIVPVNLRPIELDEELGNKFGLVFLSLPVGIADPLERLHSVKQNMDKLKSSPEPVATFGILNLIGALPPRLQEVAVAFFDTKGTTVMTNVPGPSTRLYLAGAPINTVMAWVPQSGRIALGVSIISYNGKVWLGIATDRSLIPDPEKIVDFFDAEFDYMKGLAQQARSEQQSAPSEAMQPLFSMLDKALQTLDELLAEASQAEASQEPGQ